MYREVIRSVCAVVIAVSVLVLGNMLVPTSVVHALTDGVYEYDDLGSGTARITGYIGPTGGNVDIPDKIGAGLIVVEIGPHVFLNKQLTSVTIPDSVTKIGDGAFRENALTSVALPDNLTTIGLYAFSNNQLTSLTIPDNVKTIEYSTFYNNALTSVILPDGLTTIGQSAFENNALTSVTFPASVTTIGMNAFSNNQLTSLTIPSNITTIEYAAFAKNNLTSLTLPDSLNTIESYVFSNNQLTSLTIPNNVTTIGQSAFDGNELTSLTLPDSLITIDGYAFRGNQLTSLTIPDNVTTIGMLAFADNSLTSVTLPDSLTTIGMYAFEKNELTSLTIPNNVTSIGMLAFADNKLTSVTLPDSLVTIESSAFQDNHLTMVTIPPNVATIGNFAFRNNPALSDVLVRSPTVNFMSNNIFQGSSNLTLHGDASSTAEAYASANGYRFQTITAELANLELNIPGLTFDPAARSFNLVTNANAVIVTPTPVVPFSEVKVNDVLVPYGESSASIVLAEGTQTITIDVTAPDNTAEQYNIVIEVDRTAPFIALTANPTGSTYGNVTVTVATYAHHGIDQLKWTAGNEGAAFFATDGTDVVGNEFTVTANGTYTVYAKDNLGNEAVETITIQNILTRSPSSPSSPGPIIDPDADSRTIMSTSPGVITIEVSPRDIEEAPGDDGGVKEVANLPDEVWDEIAKLLDKEDRTVIRVHINDHQPDVELHLPGNRLAELLHLNPNVEFDMQLNGSSFQMKVNILDLEQLARQLGIAIDDLTVVINISAVSGERKEGLVLAAEGQGMKLLSQPIEFQLIVSGGGKSVEITDFGGTYMTKSIVLDEQVANRNYLAVLYDPIGRTFTYVPAMMANRSNGQRNVVMQMPHNSIYAIMETDRIEFADMQGHWAKSEVEQLASKRIVSGMTINDYAPDRNITRAEFASLLVRALGIKTDRTGAGHVFEDVAAASWYAAEVEAAFKAGLVSGISRAHFAPEAQVTREQIAVMLMNAQALVKDESHAIDQRSNSLTSFTDASEVSAWAREAMSEAVALNLIQGMSKDTLAPAAPATRAQAAVMLQRFMVMIEFLE